MEVIAVITSVVALVVSIIVTISARQREEAALEGVLQGQYSQIRSRLDKRYRDENWAPSETDPDIWGPLEEYWYFCLSEYEITAKSPRGVYQKLWQKKLRDRVAAGLSHKPLRDVLVEIVRKGSMTEKYAKNFLNEMENIYGSHFLPVGAEPKKSQEVS
jgi:hypothetical protein